MYLSDKLPCRILQKRLFDLFCIQTVFHTFLLLVYEFQNYWGINIHQVFTNKMKVNTFTFRNFTYMYIGNTNSVPYFFVYMNGNCNHYICVDDIWPVWKSKLHFFEKSKYIIFLFSFDCITNYRLKQQLLMLIGYCLQAVCHRKLIQKKYGVQMGNSKFILIPNFNLSISQLSPE